MKFLVILSLIYFISPSIAKTVHYNTKYNRLNENSLPLANASAITYIKASIPTKIFQCMTKFNIFRCMKLFILQRMEASRKLPVTGNVTTDFLNTILYAKDNSVLHNIDESYLKISETELNSRLHESFQDFFKDREIKMHFIPGMVVRIVPSDNNMIDMSLKKEVAVSVGRRKGGHNKHGYLMQLGLPAMLLPMVLMGSFLPMWLPALKMATIFTGVMNNTALMAALMYLARTAALEHEQKNTVYYTPGGATLGGAHHH